MTRRVRLQQQKVLLDEHDGTSLNDSNEKENMGAATGMSSKLATKQPANESLGARGLQPLQRKITSSELSDMYTNCIKLSTENKITTKNTWQLSLIDYIDEVIGATASANPDFQLASCTLDASVKIFSCRVDSVHSETYKVLGGLARTKNSGGEAEEDEDVDGEDGEDDTTDGSGKAKKSQKKKSFTSTLEEDFASLNLKRIEASFDVDPLFARVSRMFDSGGSKGILLANLPVRADGCVIFDSTVPYSSIFSSASGVEMRTQSDARRPREALSMDAMSAETGVSGVPTQPVPLRAETAELAPGAVDPMFEDAPAPQDVYAPAEEEEEQQQQRDDAADVPLSHGDYDYGFGDSDGGDHSGLFEALSRSHRESLSAATSLMKDDAGTKNGVEHQEKQDDLFVFDFLQQGRHNTRWKFRTRQATSAAVSGSQADADPKQARASRPRKPRFVIDFMEPANMDWRKTFAKPKSQSSLTQRLGRTATVLPLASAYHPESLMHLFLKPNVVVTERRGPADDHTLQRTSFGEHGSDMYERDVGIAGDEGFGAGGNDYTYGDTWMGADGGGVGLTAAAPTASGDDPVVGMDGGEFLPLPATVDVPQIKYSTDSKVVDVRALKEKIWENVHTQQAESLMSLPAVSFQPNETIALRFICLLHLANEHGLSLSGREDMSDVMISALSS